MVLYNARIILMPCEQLVLRCLYTTCVKEVHTHSDVVPIVSNIWILEQTTTFSFLHNPPLYSFFFSRLPLLPHTFPVIFFSSSFLCRLLRFRPIFPFLHFPFLYFFQFISYIYSFIFSSPFTPLPVYSSFLARDAIYTSRAYATMSVSVCLSVCLWRKCIGAL